MNKTEFYHEFYRKSAFFPHSAGELRLVRNNLPVDGYRSLVASRQIAGNALSTLEVITNECWSNVGYFLPGLTPCRPISRSAFSLFRACSPIASRRILSWQ